MSRVLHIVRFLSETAASQISASTRKMSMLPHNDVTKQLYTLVNGVMDDVDGKIGLLTLPSLRALLELNEMSFDEFIKL